MCISGYIDYGTEMNKKLNRKKPCCNSVILHKHINNNNPTIKKI